MAERQGELAVYAVSYDSVEILSRFADAHNITYPLLADVGSRAITDLGLLNTTLAEERAAYGRPIEERHQGIPYPGSFVLDEDGIVTGKRFEQSHRIRPTANTLLRELSREGSIDVAGPGQAAAEAATPGVRLAAWLDTAVVSANQEQAVNLRIELDDGVHLYTEPIPDGYQALAVSVHGDERLRVTPTASIPGSKFSVEGLEETFYVVEGTVDVAASFFLLTNRDTAGDAPQPVTMKVSVAYQACTDTVCFAPEQVDLELVLQEVANPGYETTDEGALSPLVLRRILEGPKSAAELLELVNAALQGVQVSNVDVASTLESLASRGLVALGEDQLWSEA